MASTRQITANKRNASFPRGPLSEAAAAAIRENPLKHGLTAKHVVLSFENFAGYHELRASVVMEYLPKTPEEHRLADQVAQSYWRLLRSRRVETATFEPSRLAENPPERRPERCNRQRPRHLHLHVESRKR